MPTSPKLRSALLKLYIKNYTLISERTLRESKMKKKLLPSERQLAETPRVTFNKTQRTENGPQLEDLPRNKEQKESEQRSKPPSTRKHELLISLLPI